MIRCIIVACNFSLEMSKRVSRSVSQALMLLSFHLPRGRSPRPQGRMEMSGEVCVCTQTGSDTEHSYLSSQNFEQYTYIHV